jgi:DNA repair exonuclease SbcCD ATPase subunit
MKINKIEIQNFKNHEKTEINFKKVNLFIGGIGEGKSSIVDAISTAISGETPTKPASDYVRNTENEATISCTLEVNNNPFTLTRNLSKNSDSVDTNGHSTASVMTRLGTSKQLIKTLLNSWHFVTDSDADDRQSILSSVLSPDMKAAELKELILKHVTLYKDQHANFIDNTFDVLPKKKTQMEGLHDKAYAARRDNKKTIQHLKNTIDEKKSKLSAYDALPQSDIDKDTLERTIEHGVITGNVLRISNEIDDINKDIASKSTKISELITKIADLETTIQQSGLKDPSKDLVELTSKISIIESHIRGIKTNLGKLPLATAREEIACPYFENCRYDKILTEIESVKENLKSTLKTKEEDLEKSKIQTNDLQELAKTSSLVNELKTIVKSAKDRIEISKATVTEKTTELQKLETRREELIKLGIVDHSKISSPEARQEAAKLKAEIDLASKSIEEQIAYQNFLESAIEVYSNKTIWAETLSSSVEIFKKTLESICHTIIPKYKVSITDDMDMRFDDIAISTLSTSEKFRVGLAVQTALALVSKVGIVIVDGSDIITNTDLVIDAINSISKIEGIENIIFLSSIDILGGGKTKKIDVEVSAFQVTAGKVIALDAW